MSRNPLMQVALGIRRALKPTPTRSRADRAPQPLKLRATIPEGCFPTHAQVLGELERDLRAQLRRTRPGPAHDELAGRLERLRGEA